MRFYFGLLLLLGGYTLFYWGTVNVIRWPGIDKGTVTGTDAPSLAMLIGFTQTASVPHRIPFPYTSNEGTGQILPNPGLDQKMQGLHNQATKPNVGTINPVGSGGFATGSPIPSGVDVQQGNYNIPGM